MRKYSLLLLLCCGLALFSLNAQQRKKVENQRQEVIGRIKETEKLLSNTSKERQDAAYQVKLLQEQLNNRKALMQIIDGEIAALGDSMSLIAGQEKIQNSKLVQLQAEYAKALRSAWRTRANLQPWLLIASSSSFQESFRKWQYVRQFKNFCSRQVSLIEFSRAKLSQSKKDIATKAAAKNALKAEAEEQLLRMKADEASKTAMLQSLKSKESELKQKILAMETQKQQLNATLEAIIRDEMAKAKEKARVEAATAASTPKTSTKKSKKGTKSSKPEVDLKNPPATPYVSAEELAATDNFSKTKGRLPWPVNNGIITAAFGEHPHPVFPLIKVKNNGVGISTKTGSEVRAVFDGKIISCSYYPAFQYGIIIQHGGYYTVYMNLASVNVKPMQEIKANDVLGVVHTAADGSTTLNFEIWQGKSKQNPANWLKRK
jgi:septal ring factor EnvC (AmiA/AmiB activator)